MREIKQSRREFILRALTGPMVGPIFAATDADDSTGVQAEANKRIARLIERYDGQGIHRTGAATGAKRFLSARIHE